VSQVQINPVGNVKDGALIGLGAVKPLLAEEQRRRRKRVVYILPSKAL
jgi:hypothetical protein